jgi:hypothetical protein
MSKKTTSRKPSARVQKSWSKLHPVRVRFLAVAVAAALVGGLAYVTNNHGSTQYPPALAVQQQVCAQNGTGYCLNDWNNGGLGQGVKMYASGASHEDFQVEVADVCGGTHFVTSNCPFTTSQFQQHNYNKDYLHATIYVVKYVPKSLCVGVPGLGYESGYLEPCGTGHGTWMVGVGNKLVDAYLTSYTNGEYWLCSGGVSGGPVIFNGVSGSSGACQWSWVHSYYQ